MSHLPDIYQTAEGFFVDDEGNLIGVNQNPFPSDFDHLRQQVEESRHSPGGGFNSDIAAEVQRQQMVTEEKSAVCAPVNSAPWSIIKAIDPKLGSTATVYAGGKTENVIFWEGETSEARTCAIIVNPAYGGVDGSYTVASTTGSINNRPYAVVKWGTRNNQQTVVLDVGKGVQFNVTASAVYVDVGLDATSGAEGSMQIGASLGFGTVSRSTAAATRTVYIGQIAKNTSSASYLVPAGARALCPVWVIPFGGVPTRVLFYDINGVEVARIEGNDTSPIMTSPWALPNDAYTFVVSNLDNDTAIASVRLVFELSL